MSNQAVEMLLTVAADGTRMDSEGRRPMQVAARMWPALVAAPAKRSICRLIIADGLMID